ncbi:hypothetical protein [Polyangium spumosum]|uniref:Uncharacterized protein n=1 Tax=Polyangium spumosum TaxID=889282 RepID=A0A6N7Q4T5_9BACT|nr:hypothetical protein [Polyangium spumosum]MRG97284.1 hypothetical protein [Polyangium spumosum]
MLASVLALVAVAGCEQKKEDVAPAAPTTAKPTADLPRPPVGIAPAEAPKAAADEDDLATPEEFEEEAEKDITSATLAAEVDKLEKEIGE